ncbi:TIGR02285 family protein [Thalassospira sp. MA62]|nr:TIGR02285 family protein [Thalassospira sp. MA62]
MGDPVISERTRRYPFLVIAAIFTAFMWGATGPVYAQKHGELNWTVPPFAPAFIFKDDVLTDGYATATQNWFIKHLPQFDHKITRLPLARLLAAMKEDSGQTRCAVTLIPTPERREYIEFAQTALLHLPISLVIRSDDLRIFAPYLNDDGHIVLAGLLQDATLTSAVRIGRSYGTFIDALLGSYQNDDHITKVADDTTLVRLLKRHRIDWTLSFPSESEFYRRSQTPNLDLTTLPIEGNTSLLEATIGCANTPLGKDAVAAINAVIKQNPSLPWSEFYAQWLNPTDREWFRAARDQYIHANEYEAMRETNTP